MIGGSPAFALGEATTAAHPGVDSHAPTVAYRYPVDKLFTGTSLGNRDAFLKLSPQSDVAGLWAAQDNQFYCGRWVTQFYLHGRRAVPSETTLAPAYQETSYTLDPLHIRKRTFLPMRGEHLQVVYVAVEVDNPSPEGLDVAVMCDVHYPGFVWPDAYKIPDEQQRAKRVEHKEQNHLILSRTIEREDELRVFGSTRAEPVATYVSDRGFSRTYHLLAERRATTRIDLVMAFSGNGQRAALAEFKRAAPPPAAFEEACAFYEELARRGRVGTPDAMINRAIEWAKVNTARVQHRFHAGWGFTNDPSQDIVVARDVAWFVLGSDYVTPAFSRSVLELISDHGITEGDKVAEFIHASADPPVKVDYDLNINDDTPLIVCAVAHHYAVTRDRGALARFWPMVKGACDWIISQMRGGLVISRSQEANVWGISGWRNIIPQSQISGAVTELNSECTYALRLAGQLARELGDPETAERYRTASERLKEAINTRLVSEKTGLYLLNIDVDGEAHDDVTGDMIFPVLCGVADEPRKRQVLELLYSPEFWTPFGVRTVGKHQLNYDPDHGLQLLGGVWPNLTAWVAYSSKSYSPRRLVSGMRNIWKISEVENPKAYQNVVPGLFPERLSGETFKSRGMTMSPWVPPTYLWLAYEGLLGLEPRPDGLRVNPHLPSDWKWVGVRDLPVAGTTMSAIYYRRVLYSTIPVASRSKCEVFDEDVTRYVECDAPFALALRDTERTIVFVATDEPGEFRLRIKPPLVLAEESHVVGLRAGDARKIQLRTRAQR